MSQFSESTQAAIDYDTTILGALELSEKKWVLAVQLPGVRAFQRGYAGILGQSQMRLRLNGLCLNGVKNALQESEIHISDIWRTGWKMPLKTRTIG